MLNFIKSEYYRMIHTTGIRVFFGILSVLTILLISGISIVETQYHTTSFSYSILVSSPMFFTLMGMLTASVLYEDSKRNGIIKNSIANGIPRGKVFFSQCIVSITTATVIMTIVLTLWIFMTELFLDKTGPVHMTDLLMEIPAIYLIAVSSIVLTIVLCLCFQNGAFIFFTWLFVFFIFPTILLKFGIAVSAHFKTDFIYNIELFSDQHRKRQYEFMHYRMGYNRRYAALHNCRNFRNYYFHGNRIQAHPKSRLININMEGSHMLYIILFLISIAGGYVAFRYISLLRALKQIQKELDVIQQDLSKNQMIHLPVPNNRLKELLITINSFLDELHHERARYTKQEKEFQKQIENISHDLRTPLTSLLGYVRLYKKSQSSYISQNAELSDTLDVIERKSESLKNLITQFYDFSRLTAHDYTVNLIKIDTVKLLRESFADNCHILEETHLNVSLDLPDRPIYVLADKTALERIFFNLFQNAGRYAHTFFHITIKNEQNSIKILFANDTCSLSSEDISHLFDRFYIQESARSQGGTGLGLTIARSLAEEIGGELSVSSKKSNGNNSLLISFTLALPSC